MKLTLRYLLAYLDDILKPNDAVRIGKLIKSNRSAMDLVERIRKIIRQRRLKSPGADDCTPGLDANDVAEYLDHQTPDEQVATYEKGLLYSDERLAEVAATHQILSLVLGGDPKISASTKPRMNEVVSSFLPDNSPWPEEPTPPDSSSVLIPAMVAPTMGASAPEIVIPFEAPPRRDTGKQFLIMLLIIVGLGGWAYSIITDPAFQGADQEQLAQNNTPVMPELGNEAVNLDNAAIDTNSQTDTENSEPVSPEPVEIVKNDNSPVPVPIQPDRQTMPAQQNQPQTTTPPQLVTNNNPTPQNGKQMTPPQANQIGAEEPVDENPVLAAPLVTHMPSVMNVTNEDPLLVVHAVDEKQAVLLKSQEDVLQDDHLYVPPYSLISLVVNSGAARVTIRENSSVSFPGAIHENSLAVDIHQGQIVLETLSEAADAPLEFLEIMIDGLHWEIPLPKESIKLAIEVLPQPAQGFEQIPKEGTILASCWTSGETISIQPKGAEPVPVKQYYQLLPRLSAPVENPAEGQPDPTALANEGTTVSSVPPVWMQNPQIDMTLAQSRDQRDFNKSIQDSTNLWLDMQGIAGDPNARIAELATRVLALGDQYQSLIALLARSSHEETRTAAIRGLSLWLPKNEENKETLKAHLANTFNAETADLVYAMLWGYQQKDAKRPDISRRLVDNLRHEHVAVRELSIFWIHEMTGQKYGYRPLAVASTREQAVTSWERHLDRVGALIDPDVE